MVGKLDCIALCAVDGKVLSLIEGAEECCTEGESMGVRLGGIVATVALGIALETVLGVVDPVLLGFALPICDGTKDPMAVGCRLNPLEGSLLIL